MSTKASERTLRADNGTDRQRDVLGGGQSDAQGVTVRQTFPWGAGTNNLDAKK